jgi:hypothetical protein
VLEFGKNVSAAQTTHISNVSVAGVHSAGWRMPRCRETDQTGALLASGVAIFVGSR